MKLAWKAVAALGGGGLLLFTVLRVVTPASPPPSMPAPAPGAPPKQTPAARAAITTDAPPRLPSAEDVAAAQLARSPVARVEGFRRDLKTFVDEAETYPVNDYQARAKALLERVDEFRRQGYLSAPEALTLRLGLLKHTMSQEAYKAEADALIAQARAEAEAAERARAATPDPRLERYHAEERRIIDEAARSQRFADEQSRQAWLQAELTALRARIYQPAARDRKTP